jgi:hypothetical protein
MALRGDPPVGRARAGYRGRLRGPLAATMGPPAAVPENNFLQNGPWLDRPFPCYFPRAEARAVGRRAGCALRWLAARWAAARWAAARWAAARSDAAAAASALAA